MAPGDCPMCRGVEADEELGRVEVWADALWRLTVGQTGVVPGFSYLEPKRHIPYVTDLDGAEAKTFGPVLARVTRVLKEATGSDIVYIYVFGDGVPHFHVHLAPHRSGDALNVQMIRGEVAEEKLPSGMTRIVSRDFPKVPREEQAAIAARVRDGLAQG